jgi:hypothetical protein
MLRRIYVLHNVSTVLREREVPIAALRCIH